MNYPIGVGNVVLIILGVILVISGPIISYKTIVNFKKKEFSSFIFHIINEGLNIIIAILFFVAGILFIVNNLKGNPLSL